MSQKQFIKFLKIIIPLGLGVFLIWYSLASATAEQRQTLWDNIKNANPYWVGLSLFLGVLSHLSRAYRWQFLLQPLGYTASLSNRFMAVMVAYVANLGIPRSGEMLRGATLTTYDEIPFEKAFGTIISERIADLVMLLLVVAVALLLQSDDLLVYLQEKNINPLWTVGLLVLGIILLYAFVKVLQHSKHTFALKVRKFVSGLLQGMRSILKMKHKIAFILHTFFIWIMYILMFWVVKYTVPELADASFGVIMAAFVIGSFSISATNGGIGVYPVAIGALLMVFGYSKASGEAFGWILWSAQTFLNLILGGLSFILLPILNTKKLQE